MPETLVNSLLLVLLPLFLTAAGNDEDLARRTALETLLSYEPETPVGYIMAAESIAASFATLDSLAKSVAGPDIGVTTCLRLRGNANALSRISDRNRRHLAGQPPASRPKPAPINPLEKVNPVEKLNPVEKIREALVEAAPMLAEQLTNATQAMSRQQKRFLARKAEQARVAVEKQARRAAQVAERNARIARTA